MGCTRLAVERPEEPLTRYRKYHKRTRVGRGKHEIVMRVSPRIGRTLADHRIVVRNRSFGRVRCLSTFRFRPNSFSTRKNERFSLLFQRSCEM